MARLFPQAREVSSGQEVAHFDDNVRVASFGFVAYSCTLVEAFANDDKFTKVNSDVGAARAVLSICNLLQTMYKAHSDDETRSDAVKASLARVPKSGPYTLRLKVREAVSTMVL